jgi:hypothetical protein
MAKSINPAHLFSKNASKGVLNPSSFRGLWPSDPLVRRNFSTVILINSIALGKEIGDGSQ